MTEEAQGVYVIGRDGRPVLVHAYINENYGLGDVHGSLQLGTLAETEEALSVTLTRKEIVDLKNLSDAFAFDYDEGFVEMCQEMHRAAEALPGDTVMFVERI